jgi:hypothetical protein
MSSMRILIMISNVAYIQKRNKNKTVVKEGSAKMVANF